jgi:hypothetical protein
MRSKNSLGQVGGLTIGLDPTLAREPTLSPPQKCSLPGGDFALLWLKASLAPELVIDVWSRNRILRHVRLETGAILRYIRPSNAGVSRRLNGIGGPPERREVCADLAVIPRTEFPRHFVIDSE